MEASRLAALAFKHAVNAAAEEIYLHTGHDYTKPVTFYAFINEHCNVKCRYCEFWRLKHYVKEMTIDEWKNALSSVKDFVGDFSINFSGGEPFIKPGFIDLLAWCTGNGISAGVTTNGSALTPRNAARIVASNPFNVNISVDSADPKLHDHLRGYDGLFEKLSNGIGYLLAERERQGKKFPITIKPTVNAKNFRGLPELVEWAVAIGASSVSPQPVDRWTPETYDELWIEHDDLPELERVIERLIEMQQAGAPLLIPAETLRLMVDHFREKKAPVETMPCRVGLRNFFIRADGTVALCSFYPAVGSLLEQSARDIWYGPQAQEIRRQTVACDRLCLMTCLSQKTLKDKVKMGVRLLQGQNRQGQRQGNRQGRAPNSASAA
jgi:MoaA/NifB/PqqE/SkfB family radical SAM enzyme